MFLTTLMGDKEAIKTSFCFLGMPLFFDLIESFSILVIGPSANLNTGTVLELKHSK